MEEFTPVANTWPRLTLNHPPSGTVDLELMFSHQAQSTPPARLHTFSLIALYLQCSLCWYVAPEQEDMFLAVAGMEHGGERDPTALKKGRGRR